VAHESDVRGWRHRENPVRPVNILPILRVLYGDIPAFAEKRERMRDAWRRAGGIRVEEPPPPLRAIETKSFSEVAEIVELAVSQPTPDNNGNLIVPFTLRIHPDKDCVVGAQAIEIGVAEALAVIESEHWRPAADSVFRGKPHPNTARTAAAGAALLNGPVVDGRIDGNPLGDEPKATLEPRVENVDGPIEFSIRVARDSFVVTPRGAPAVSGTQKAVLDALFADAFPRDRKNRLKVASETVRSRAVKRAE
jgi:hypothetical protein